MFQTVTAELILATIALVGLSVSLLTFRFASVRGAPRLRFWAAYGAVMSLALMLVSATPPGHAAPSAHRFQHQTGR